MVTRRIAVEEAFVTPEIMAQWHVVLAGRDVEPGFAKMGETILAPTPANKLLDERLLDIGAGRIAHMDSIGIDMQILSLTSPGVQVFDGPLATRLAAESNDVLAAAVTAHPARFAGLAAIAPQEPAAAAREIERAARTLGLCGVIINSHTMGEYLDAARYRPIFEAAEALDLPIYLHPREPAPSMVTLRSNCASVGAPSTALVLSHTLSPGPLASGAGLAKLSLASSWLLRAAETLTYTTSPGFSARASRTV